MAPQTKPKHAHLHEHEHEDDEAEGCLCDITLAADEETSDDDLPAAIGGVAGDVMDPDDDVDGCDLDFKKGKATADADLPAATGGVE